jgi:predicted NUDIX family NTP pyrophosphohydrolase
MARASAGILLFRKRAGGLEVFLVHPGGPFWSKKDDGAWSIPKGELAQGEDPFAAAIREFEEETGVVPRGTATPLKPVRQAGGKLVYAWAMEGDLDERAVKSNTFRLEWPPKSGKHREFPEIDEARWFPVELAEKKILRGQLPLLCELLRSRA